MELKANDGWYYLGWQGYTRRRAAESSTGNVIGGLANHSFGTKELFILINRVFFIKRWHHRLTRVYTPAGGQKGGLRRSRQWLGDCQTAICGLALRPFGSQARFFEADRL